MQDARKKELAKKLKKKVSQLSAEAAPKERTAIALRYDIEKDAVPLVLAVGKGNIADYILKVAEEYGIPLYEDKGLAGILSKLEIESEIPPELYVLVAEILAFIFKLESKASKRAKFEKGLKKYGR